MFGRCFLGLLTMVALSAQQDAPTAGTRELFYQAAAPKDKLPPIASASTRPPKKGPETTPSNTAGNTAGNGASNAAPNGAPGSNVVNVAATGAVNLGIRYNLVLVESETRTTQVDSDHVFKSGDRVAIELSSNHSGYLYVLARQSSGSWLPLMPSPEMPDESNIIDPGVTVRIPKNYFFELQDPPGIEHLVLILSRNPQDVYDLYRSIKEQGHPPAGAPARRTEAPLVADATNDAIKKMQVLGTRDIGIVKAHQPSRPGEPVGSVFVVNTSSRPASNVFAEIDIRHR